MPGGENVPSDGQGYDRGRGLPDFDIGKSEVSQVDIPVGDTSREDASLSATTLTMSSLLIGDPAKERETLFPIFKSRIEKSATLAHLNEAIQHIIYMYGPGNQNDIFISENLFNQLRIMKVMVMSVQDIVYGQDTENKNRRLSAISQAMTENRLGSTLTVGGVQLAIDFRFLSEIGFVDKLVNIIASIPDISLP